MSDTSNNPQVKLEPKPATIEAVADSGNNTSSETFLPKEEEGAHPDNTRARSGAPEPEAPFYAHLGPPPHSLSDADRADREHFDFCDHYPGMKREAEEMAALELCYQRLAETSEQMGVVKQGIVLCQKHLQLMGDILLAMEQDYAQLYRVAAPAWPWYQANAVQYPAWPW